MSNPLPSTTSSLSLRLLLVSYALSLVSFALSQDCGIATYWGQNGTEGKLREACDTDLYAYVNIAFLDKFGNHQIPELNLDSHDVDPASLNADIQYCQSKGIKVMLSIGGPGGNYGLDSAQDAAEVAAYLWNNFLGGISHCRPLGDAVLDGIDFYVVNGLAQYYDDLLMDLNRYNALGKKVYFTAAPQCSFPGEPLQKALGTGLFDHVWVRFYNNTACEYASENSDDLITSWGKWTTSYETHKLLLGLVADIAAGTGYIPPEELISQIFPQIKESAKYGGVMVWSRYHDKQHGYSLAIKDTVCKPLRKV